MSASQLKLEKVGEREYRFMYPRFISHFDDLIYDASDLIDVEEYVEAKSILHTIIDAFPEHIEAHHYLALCMDYQGEEQVAFHLWEKAVEIGMAYFPKGESATGMQLNWEWLENRPFLEAYEGLGMAYYNQDDTDEAVKIFTHLLALNPADHQGIRGRAIQAYFESGKPGAVLDICELYPEDGIADTLYGRLLALFQLKRKHNVEGMLKRTIECLPFIAKEIVRPHHTELDIVLESEVFDEEKIEALDYWENFGHYWLKTSGAIELLRRGLTRYHKESS